MYEQLTLNLFPLPEEWRPVGGWEDWYEVSDLGRVRRIAPRCPGGVAIAVVRQTHLSTSGYPQLTLTRPGKRATLRVHRLVAHAFLGPCPWGRQVNHKDFNTRNAAANNLEYVTQLANAHHALLHRAQAKRELAAAP